MNAFADAGIWVWLDLDTFNTTIIQTSPAWTETQLLAFSDVMDAFHRYDNLGGFWIGNEVINNAGGSPAAPYIKAAVADMKSYMAAKNYRQIPIGYSAADIAELRPMLQNYLTCGGDPDQSIDFFGLNSYEWCGNSNYETSGYSNLEAMAQGFPVPIFFSETGCNVPRPRTFADQTTIFGPKMLGTWSGSIIYEWVLETNDYGVVTYPDDKIYSGAPIPVQPDFDNLSSVWKNIKPTGVAEADYSPSISAPLCPGPTDGWQVNGNVPLPTLGNEIITAAAASVKATPTATPESKVSKSTGVTSSSTLASRALTGSPLGTAASATGTARQEGSAATSTSTSKAAGSHVVVPALGGGIMWFLGLLV